MTPVFGRNLLDSQLRFAQQINAFQFPCLYDALGTTGQDEAVADRQYKLKNAWCG